MLSTSVDHVSLPPESYSYRVKGIGSKNEPRTTYNVTVSILQVVKSSHIIFILIYITRKVDTIRDKIKTYILFYIG